MLKGLAFNPFIDHNSTLDEIETELASLLDYAEKVMDWDISEYEEKRLMMLTRLARAKGSTRRW